MHDLIHTLNHDMFMLPLPLAEKVLRPVVVYLFLVVFLRIFGKRELAQLNPFDLVVLLSLSNTVQNAMIGDDNSVTGGLVGALSLLAVNWVLTWVLFRSPKATKVLEGEPATLVRRGVVQQEELKKQSLTHEELISVLNKNGFNGPADVETCVLEPNGTFYVEGKRPSEDSVERGRMMAALAELSAEVKALRGELAAKGSAGS
jgi:uncharacterized membrane protein YcaP (DUF421 family)